MPSESEIIIAFIFNRSGKNKMSFSEFYLSLSMDLKWFTPNQAKEFVNRALKQDFLKKEKDLLKPVFDYKKTVVPIGFYPSKKDFEQKKEEQIIEEDFIKVIIKRIAEKTLLDDEKIMDEINEIKKEKNVTLEVATLILGKKYNVVLEDFLKETEKKIFT